MSRSLMTKRRLRSIAVAAVVVVAAIVWLTAGSSKLPRTWSVELPHKRSLIFWSADGGRAFVVGLQSNDVPGDPPPTIRVLAADTGEMIGDPVAITADWLPHHEQIESVHAIHERAGGEVVVVAAARTSEDAPFDDVVLIAPAIDRLTEARFPSFDPDGRGRLRFVSGRHSSAISPSGRALIEFRRTDGAQRAPGLFLVDLETSGEPLAMVSERVGWPRLHLTESFAFGEDERLDLATGAVTPLRELQPDLTFPSPAVCSTGLGVVSIAGSPERATLCVLPGDNAVDAFDGPIVTNEFTSDSWIRMTPCAAGGWLGVQTIERNARWTYATHRIRLQWLHLSDDGRVDRHVSERFGRHRMLSAIPVSIMEYVRVHPLPPGGGFHLMESLHTSRLTRLERVDLPVVAH